jgi:predicted nucleotidyltransferase
MNATAEQTATVQEMKRAILAGYDPEAIILFGSLGRGDGDEFSDVDLLVVIETDQDIKNLSEEMTRYLDPLARDKHVIVRTPMEFCRCKDIPGTLVFSAVNEGQILFEKAEWQINCEVTDSYEKRKRAVISKDYVLQAQDFLNQAESYLREGNLFRCRDYAKFAAVRALKGIFVRHDIHPPRELDLVLLMKAVESLEPELGESAAFLQELNGYCPAGGDTPEILKCRRLLESLAVFVKGIADRV